MSGLTIREMEQDEDFAEWFAELFEMEAGDAAMSDRYLVLSNEIGDWIGGLRFQVRGGVAQLVELAVASEHRSVGHGRRLLEAFEARARDVGAHLLEFWTDDPRVERRLAALGWHAVLRRKNYIGGRDWLLLEKRPAR